MAGILVCAQTAETALVAATAKTVIQLVAPTNQRLILRRWAVFFDGISGTAEPVQVALVRQTTAGTASALTPVRLGAGSETLQATAQQNASAEPTTTDTLDVAEVHPQSGIDIILPQGLEIVVTGGTRLGIVCTAPAVVNVRCKLWYEE